MKNIYETKFSKIGTNPNCYFENYKKYINRFLKGTKFIKKDLNLYFENEIIFNANSSTTFRQNLDAWLWMGFLIKINENEFIKIVDELNEDTLKQNIKWNLLKIDSSDLINQHRNTIIIKLLYADNENNINKNLVNVSFEEIKKECGKFEEIIIQDKQFVEIIKKIWGASNE